MERKKNKQMTQTGKSRDFLHIRYLSLLVLVLNIASAILLASYLPNLEFKHGQLEKYLKMPSEIGELEQISMIEDESTAISDGPLATPLIYSKRFLIISALIVTSFIAIFLLRSLGGRKFILMLLVLGILLFLIFNILSRYKQPILFHPAMFGRNISDNPVGEIEEPVPPSWLVIAATVGISGLIIGILFFILKRERDRVKPLDKIAEEAKKTIHEIQSDGNLKEVVINCYFEMMRIVKTQKGLKRDQSATTRELEIMLKETGLPEIHVKRLTRLFEKVRYGGKDTIKEEEDEAISCLQAIVKAVRDQNETISCIY